MRIQAHVHRGYWEDVGTIRAYYLANLALCQPVPPFDFYDALRPVYTHPRFLPGSRLGECRTNASIVSVPMIGPDDEVIGVCTNPR